MSGWSAPTSRNDSPMVVPEAARIERDRRADRAAPRQFEGEPRAHRTADHVDTAQIVLRQEPFERVGERGDRHRAGEGRCPSEAGEIGRDHVARGGQLVEYRLPGAPVAAQAMNQQQRLALSLPTSDEVHRHRVNSLL